MILEAISLGLSTGTYCTMNCAPVLIPFLSGSEKVSYKRNSGLIGAFLGGRLVMYFILGAVFAGLGFLVNEFMDPVLSRRLSVYAYFFCGLALLINSLGGRFPWGCGKGTAGGETSDGKECGCKVPRLRRPGNDWVTAIVSGLAVGLHVCPPLWTAMLRSFFGGCGPAGFFYFIFFYLGTLPFFLPLFGIPFIAKRALVIKRIARVTQLCIGLYFMIFLGLIPMFFE